MHPEGVSEYPRDNFWRPFRVLNQSTIASGGLRFASTTAYFLTAFQAAIPRFTLNAGKDARAHPSSPIATDGGIDRHERDGCSDAYEDYGQHRVAMTAVVVDAFHVRITNGRRRVRLAIAHHELFITRAINIAFHLGAIVQSDCGARFRSHAKFRNAAFCMFEVAGLLACGKDVDYRYQ